MSFSWGITDKDGKDLLEEFKINYQAIGLGDTSTTYGLDSIRGDFCNTPYKDRLQDAAQDAVRAVKFLVQTNIEEFTAPEHDCPSCTCPRTKLREPAIFNGFDLEQARRFLSIPIERVWRASGGY